MPIDAPACRNTAIVARVNRASFTVSSAIQRTTNATAALPMNLMNETTLNLKR
jgi:hypothetical protein